MRNRLISTIMISVFAVAFAACGGSEEQPKNTAKPNANMPANKTANESNLTTVPKTPEPATNDAPTLGPVFKGLCAAIAKKDDAAVRKFYSAAALKGFEADMKEEKTTSLVAFLETDQIADCQVSNEKIEGDNASALVKTTGAPNGARMKFVKEGGEWKLTGETVDVQSIKPGTGNPNTGK